MNLFQIKDMVEQELTDYPETRGNDRVLLCYVYRDYYGISNQSFYEVMMRKDLPNPESIRRSRQKLQEENIDLRADAYIEKARLGEQVKFINFAREGR